MTGLPVRSFKKGFGFTGTVCTRTKRELCVLVGGRCFATGSMASGRREHHCGSSDVKLTAAIFAKPSAALLLRLESTSVKCAQVLAAVERQRDSLRMAILFLRIRNSSLKAKANHGHARDTRDNPLSSLQAQNANANENINLKACRQMPIFCQLNS